MINLLFVVCVCVFIAPVLTVSLDPPSVVALDVPPFNSFTLCCNGSAAVDNTAATMLVEWSKQMAGNAVRTVLASNGASVNISTTTIPGSIISELATVETSAGRYTYTCTVSVQEPGDDPVVENANATVTIRGMCFTIVSLIAKRHSTYTSCSMHVSPDSFF